MEKEMKSRPASGIDIALTVNGETHHVAVSPRTLLVDALRDRLGLTGTHIGCEHGGCGACTVLLEGDPVRSCLLFASQVDGSNILTVEGLNQTSSLHPLQEAFQDEHGLQCGFCTPGMITMIYWYMNRNPTASESDIREALVGNLCRCTGYVNIVNAAKQYGEHLATNEQ